jgi:hypothetical protein
MYIHCSQKNSACKKFKGLGQLFGLWEEIETEQMKTAARYFRNSQHSVVTPNNIMHLFIKACMYFTGFIHPFSHEIVNPGF